MDKNTIRYTNKLADIDGDQYKQWSQSSITKHIMRLLFNSGIALATQYGDGDVYVHLIIEKDKLPLQYNGYYAGFVTL